MFCDLFELVDRQERVEVEVEETMRDIREELTGR